MYLGSVKLSQHTGVENYISKGGRKKVKQYRKKQMR